MKKILTFLTVALTFSMAQGNADLEASMKSIGEQFKVIATGIQTRKLTEKELQAVETMQKEIAVSSLIYPDAATTDALKITYSQWMAELMQMALNLEETVELTLEQPDQNLEAVTQEFIAINELRKKGHDLFKK